MVILSHLAAFLAGVAAGLAAWGIERRVQRQEQPPPVTGFACGACGSTDMHPGFYHDWCGRCGWLGPHNDPPRRELGKQ